MPIVNQRVVLASRPDGRPTLDNFRLEETSVPKVGQGQMLLRTLYLSLDPYMRGRMDARESYADPIAVGEVMEGGTVAEVVASHHAGFAPGDIVLSHSGWQRFAVSDGEGLRKLDPTAAPITTALGVLGMPAFAAYVGLRTIAQPQHGETLVVAAASGAVGSAVGQMAKIAGARVVSIAGGPAKCAYVRDALRFDAVVDHRSPEFAEALATACPNGIDVYFENVGGAVWDAVQPLLNAFARVPICGLVAYLDQEVCTSGDPVGRLPAAMIDISVKSLRVQGFVQLDHAALCPDFYREASAWVAEGRLRYREDVIDGLDRAPEAFLGMLKGRNFGKLLVRVGNNENEA